MIRDVDLAWALALAVKPQLNIGERNYVFVTIGAGDTFAAIGNLLKCIAVKRIPIGPDLAQRCASWLDAYVGHEDELRLRRLIEDYIFPFAVEASVALMLNRLPSAAQRSQLAASSTEWTKRAHLVHHV